MKNLFVSSFLMICSLSNTNFSELEEKTNKEACCFFDLLEKQDPDKGLFEAMSCVNQIDGRLSKDVTYLKKITSMVIPINGDIEKCKRLTLDFIKLFCQQESSIRQSHNDQFFTYNSQELINILEPISLDGYTILEIGSGTGIISNAIFNKNPKKLIVNELDPAIDYEAGAGKNIEIIKEDFRAIDFTNKKDGKFGIIANPPYNLLSDVRNLIDQQNILDVLLIIPAWRYNELFSDFMIVGALQNKDFQPVAESKNNVHLIIQKGFSNQNCQAISSDQVVVGRHQMHVEEFARMAKKKFPLSEGISQQIPEHLGGKTFESLDAAVEFLRSKEIKQLNGIFYKIQNADWTDQERLLQRYKKDLLPQEVDALSTAIIESKAAHAAWLVLQQALEQDSIVIGQRTEINALRDKDFIEDKEILNIPAEIWNWHINKLWIKTAIKLKKVFFVTVKDSNSLFNVIKCSKSGAEFLALGERENNEYVYRSDFQRPSYLGQEIAILLDANYTFSLDERKGQLIIKGEPSIR